MALIAAVFGAGDSGAGSPAERYCRHFETPRLREERWDLPPVDAQEPLSAFVTRYERLGVEAMAATVFEDLTLFPGTEHVRAGYALSLARGLRHLGVDTFQDLAALRPGALDAALRIKSGFDAGVVRSLMSYAGGDDFVWGDAAVRGFVALALGAETVTPQVLMLPSWTTPCSSRNVMDSGTRTRRQLIGLIPSSRTLSCRIDPGSAADFTDSMAGNYPVPRDSIKVDPMEFCAS